MLLLFLTLPALTLGAIKIHVLGSFDGGNSNFTAYVSNDDVAIISDKDRTAFHLDDSAIKKSVEVTHGKKPDQVFVKNPTPWGNIFTQYNWKQVERKTTLINAGLVSTGTKPKVIDQQIFENNSTIPMTVNIAMSKKKKNVILSSWPKLDDISAANIKYIFNFDVKGITKFLNQEFAWGEGAKKKSHSEILGSNSESKLILQPNQSVTAQLIVNRGVIRFNFDYVTSLAHDIVVNYDTEFKGHHFYSCEVNNVLGTIPSEEKLTSTNKIVVAFYYDAKIIVKDNQAGTTLMDKQLSRPAIQDRNRLSGHAIHKAEIPAGKKIAITLSDDGTPTDDEADLDELDEKENYV